ncbi:MAG: histidine--tRNA ligase [Candidatus Micrarchaeota archaeon]
MNPENEKDEKLEDVSLAAPRGTRDFLFEEKLLRDGVVNVLKNTFELYGFTPFETPAFEKWSVLSSKYAGGAEILKETYKFQDQGKRELGLRYDLTVPLCRVIAANPNLPMPVKRYAIGPVFRDGPLKLGRYREFIQCDVDIVGCKSGVADAEVLALVCDAFTALGINFVIKVNNRKLLEGLLEKLGVTVDSIEIAILSIDKLTKIGREGVQKELVDKGISISASRKILETILEFEELKASETLSKCSKLVKGNAKAEQGLIELQEVFDYLESFDKTENISIDISLARGLSYYTGTVFEAYCRNCPITSSLAGGGRYDNLIGQFAGRESIPAIGISFGLDVISEVLKLKGNKMRKTNAEVYVIPIKTISQCIETASELRSAGVRTAVDLIGRSISKNLEYAAKQGFTYAAIIGPKEAEKKKITLRNLETGVEKLVTVKEAVELIRSN